MSEANAPNSEALAQTLLTEIDSHLAASLSHCRRVFHGRGKAFDGLAHLNIEWYPPYLFVQNFGEPLDQMLSSALQSLQTKYSEIEAILVQAREWPDFKTDVLPPPSGDNTEQEAPDIELPISGRAALTDTLHCEISLGKNRNTGVFLDMRAGWHWINQNAQDKRVLNLFCYTGVFSLFALEGGAVQVDNVDMAANVLKIAQRNHQKNGLHDGKTAFYKRDILKSDRWFESREPYDIIIIDPPPYQKKAFRGWVDYTKLLKTCRQSLAEGGKLFACLNNPQATMDEFITDLKQLFPDAKAIIAVERAPEIRERDNTKGLKTVVIEF